MSGWRVVLSIGSNVGDRLGHLRSAVAAFRRADVSPVYETDPVGGPEQDAYLNAVLVVRNLKLDDAWAVAQACEQRAGRTRGELWGPRTLDVDVVTAGHGHKATPHVHLGLDLPHPRAHERAFVLVPWLDVDRDAWLPGHGRVDDLVAALDTSGVRRRDGLALT